MSTLHTSALLLALFLTITLAGSLAVALHDATAQHLAPWLTTRARARLSAWLERTRSAPRAPHHQARASITTTNPGTPRRRGTENLAALARGTRDARSGETPPKGIDPNTTSTHARRQRMRQ